MSRNKCRDDNCSGTPFSLNIVNNKLYTISRDGVEIYSSHSYIQKEQFHPFLLNNKWYWIILSNKCEIVVLCPENKNKLVASLKLPIYHFWEVYIPRYFAYYFENRLLYIHESEVSQPEAFLDENQEMDTYSFSKFLKEETGLFKSDSKYVLACDPDYGSYSDFAFISSIDGNDVRFGILDLSEIENVKMSFDNRYGKYILSNTLRNSIKTYEGVDPKDSREYFRIGFTQDAFALLSDKNKK